MVGLLALTAGVAGLVLWSARSDGQAGAAAEPSAAAPAPQEAAPALESSAAADRTRERLDVPPAVAGSASELPTTTRDLTALLDGLEQAAVRLDVATLHPSELRGSEVDDLRRFVLEQRLSAAELESMYAELEAEDPLRQAVVLSMAWAEGPREERARWLGEHSTRFPGGPPGAGAGAIEGESLAALHAMRLGAMPNALARSVSTLTAAMKASAASGVDPFSTSTALDNGFRIALDGLAASSREHPADRELVDRLLAELTVPGPERGRIPHAAWRLAAATNGTWAERTIAAARAGDGGANEALACFRDEALLSELRSLIEQPDKSVYENHLAERSMAGLLSIGSRESIEALAGYIRNPASRSARSNALDAVENYDAGSAGELVWLWGELEGDAKARRTVEERLEDALEEAARTPTGSPRRAEVRNSLRRAIDSLSPRSEAYARCVALLAERGTAEDVALLRAAASASSAPREVWDAIDRLAATGG